MMAIVCSNDGLMMAMFSNIFTDERQDLQDLQSPRKQIRDSYRLRRQDISNVEAPR